MQARGAASRCSATWRSSARTLRATTAKSGATPRLWASTSCSRSVRSQSHYGDQTEIPSVRSVAGVDEAIAALDELLQPGDCVLVKASRSVGLEVVAEALAGARV